MSRSPSEGRPIPDWLIDGEFEDQTLGVLKSGKEAEVFLVERRGKARTCLLAHKRFRPRHPKPGELRELGFTHGAIYRHDSVYREGWNLNARDRRAVRDATRYGQEVRAELWPANEFAVLERAWAANVSVPYPVGRTDDGILMELIGDRDAIAPRLVQARLDRDDLRLARDQLIQGLQGLAAARIVHADLSVYNLLWWRGRLVIIDFPQAVDAVTNAEAPNLLHRDLTNVATWFGRRGIQIEIEPVFAELVTLLFSS